MFVFGKRRPNFRYFIISRGIKSGLKQFIFRLFRITMLLSLKLSCDPKLAKIKKKKVFFLNPPLPMLI